jgi:hypothetical protein
VIVGTPALSQSVPEARQNNKTLSGTLRPAAIVSVVGAFVNQSFFREGSWSGL